MSKLTTSPPDAPLGRGRRRAPAPLPRPLSPSFRRKPESGLSDRVRSVRRNQRGLAGHEWLLLITAVAGFTALATFVLAETVDDAVARAGADDPARLASARRAATLVENEAKTITPEASGGTWRRHLWGEWADHFQTRCLNIRNAFRSAGVTVTAEFNHPKNRPRDESMVKPGGPDKGKFETNVARALARANRDPPASGKPQVRCEVTTP